MIKSKNFISKFITYIKGWKLIGFVVCPEPVTEKPKYSPVPQKSNLKLKGEEMNKDSINMGKEANSGMTRDDSKTATRLLDKNWSPLIVRKYQMEGWPLFIGIICDCNLNDLDEVIYDLTEKARDLGFMDGNIQSARNYCGFLNEGIVKYYNNIKRGSCEGVMVCWYIDKCWISAAYGDLMVHEKCVSEFYHIVNTLPHI